MKLRTWWTSHLNKAVDEAFNKAVTKTDRYTGTPTELRTAIKMAIEESNRAAMQGERSDEAVIRYRSFQVTAKYGNEIEILSITKVC